MPKKRTSAAKSPADSGPRGSAKNLTVSLPELLVDGSDLKFRERVAAEYAILLATWHLQKKGPVGINTLAGQLHVAAANVTAEVGKLVTKGILDKQPHPKDSRAVLIRLTADGTAILHELTPLLRRINDRLFSGNRARDMDAVANFLRHIADETPNSIHLAKSFHPRMPLREERRRKPSAKESRQ